MELYRFLEKQRFVGFLLSEIEFRDTGNGTSAKRSERTQKIFRVYRGKRDEISGCLFRVGKISKTNLVAGRCYWKRSNDIGNNSASGGG